MIRHYIKHKKNVIGTQITQMHDEYIMEIQLHLWTTIVWPMFLQQKVLLIYSKLTCS